MNEALLVFVRWPEPGRTKTRLIPTLGAEHAAAVYRRMAEALFRQAAALRRPGLELRALVEPPKRVADAGAWLGEEVVVAPQAGGDLGDRLKAGFARAFEAGATRVVAIGTDCPQLTAGHLGRAFEALHRHQAVVGPALDGGYYLIGLSQPLLHVFEGVPWSAADTLAATLGRLRQVEASVFHLGPLRDLDDGEDWQVLSRELPWLEGGGTGSRDPGTLMPAITEWVVERAHPFAGVRVLEVGCCSGVGGRAWLPWLGATGRYLGIHSAPARIETALQDRVSEQLDYQVAAVEELPAGQPFDRIVLNSAMGELSEPLATLDAAARVLAPGGLLLCGGPPSRFGLPPVRDLPGSAALRQPGASHGSELTLDRLEQWAVSVGLMPGRAAARTFQASGEERTNLWQDGQPDGPIPLRWVVCTFNRPPG